MSWDDAVAEHRTSTRSRLIAATMSLLAEHGMAGTTMTAIAERAGVSRPTLYKHFPDVDHIVAALAREEFRVFRATIDAEVDAAWPAVRQLEHLVRTHLRYFGSERARHGDGSLEAGTSPVVRAAVEEELVEHHARLTSVIAAGIEDGSFRSDLDADLAAEIVQHVLGGLRHTIRRHDTDPEALTHAVTGLLLHGVASEPSEPAAAPLQTTSGSGHLAD